MSDVSQAEADAAFARMVAAHPGAIVIGAPAHVNVLRAGEGRTEGTEGKSTATAPSSNSALPAAEGRVHSVPSGIGTWKFSSDLSAERLDEIKGMLSMNAGMGTMAGPAGKEEGDSDGEEVMAGSVLGGAALGGGGSSWTFSSHLSPERLAAFQAMVGATSSNTELSDATNGIALSSDGVNVVADVDSFVDNTAAAEAAFERMIAENPGSTEIAPGVFASF